MNDERVSGVVWGGVMWCSTGGTQFEYQILGTIERRVRGLASAFEGGDVLHVSHIALYATELESVMLRCICNKQSEFFGAIQRHAGALLSSVKIN